MHAHDRNARKVKILERAETIGDCPLRPERLWENVTRPILDRVTLCYVRFECFSLLRNSGIINGSEISNLQNWTVGLGASRKNAFGPEGWAAIPACFIPICAGACACMGHWIVRSSRNHYWIQTDRVLDYTGLEGEL